MIGDHLFLDRVIIKKLSFNAGKLKFGVDIILQTNQTKTNRIKKLIHIV